MRSIWSGALSFGLINIPVRLYSAVKQEEPKFHFLHKEDFSPIRFAKVCRADGREIPYEDIVKGYEYAKGDYIVLTDEDFAKASPKRAKTIEIVEFVKEDEVDPMYFEKPYYLEPGENAEKAYLLLREALKESGRVGIARFVIKNKEHLAAIRPEGKFLMAHQMNFQNDIRLPADLKPPHAKIAQRELEMALRLIEELTDKFRPEEFHDSYTKEVKRIIADKAAHHSIKTPKGEPQFTKVSDLMDILKKSLEREKQKTGAST